MTEEQKETILSHMSLLGMKVTDKITGFAGVVSSVCYDAYGCIQACITPPAEGGKLGEQYWMDVTRLEVKSKKPVMPIPLYSNGYVAQGKRGCAEKPQKQ